MMAKTNLGQHEQHLKLLEASIKEIDDSYQHIIDSHQQMYNGLSDVSNLIFKLYLIANDLRETRLLFEKEQGEGR